MRITISCSPKLYNKAFGGFDNFNVCCTVTQQFSSEVIKKVITVMFQNNTQKHAQLIYLTVCCFLY